MIIKKLKASNFRSFKDIDITLNKFNLIIGANASGKSNFISILNFIKNIAEYDIEDAISLLGGIEYIRNIYFESENTISVEIEIELGEEEYSEEARGYASYDELNEIGIGYRTLGFIYNLKLVIDENKKEFYVKEENINLNIVLVKVNLGMEDFDEEIVGSGILKTLRNGNNISFDIEILESELDPEKIKETLILKKEMLFMYKAKKNRSILKNPPFFIDYSSVEENLKKICNYEINPKSFKNFSIITGKSELESDGSNLILILRRLLNDKDKKNDLTTIIRNLLPFIKTISIRKFGDKYIYANVTETFSAKKSLPASLMSDGTINIIALIVILFFEKKPIIIIEEPESNIHPYLISKLIDLMNDVSSRLGKQIIITTHNPELVKYTKIENIFLIHREENGFSTVSKPLENEAIKYFLEKDMGMDELFVQNLLK